MVDGKVEDKLNFWLLFVEFPVNWLKAVHDVNGVIDENELFLNPYDVSLSFPQRLLKGKRFVLDVLLVPRLSLVEWFNWNWELFEVELLFQLVLAFENDIKLLLSFEELLKKLIFESLLKAFDDFWLTQGLLIDESWNPRLGTDPHVVPPELETPGLKLKLLLL